MITSDKIKAIAAKNQSSELNIRREYVQNIFLSYFYGQQKTTNIYFKGGTALRLVYGNPRFSEDLDFSSPSENIKDIEKIIEDTLIEIEREGIKTEIIEAKKTSGGYLATLGFSLGSEKVTIRIEISFREKNVKEEVITIVNNFIPSYTILCLAKEQLINQKIQALLTRQKPRDFYDFYFILRAQLLPKIETKVLKLVSEKVKNSRISFDKELNEFLPKSHWNLIKDFKITLEREIQRFI